VAPPDRKPHKDRKPADDAQGGQRPGEEVVQVNDPYDGGGSAPDEPTKDEQHPTGG